MQSFAGKLLEFYGLPAHFGLDMTKFKSYCIALQDGYFPNPYHNPIHVCDVRLYQNFLLTKQVLQAFHSLLQACGPSKFTNIEIFAGLFSCLVRSFLFVSKKYRFMTSGKQLFCSFYQTLQTPWRKQQLSL